jgi:hypothetical protein
LPARREIETDILAGPVAKRLSQVFPESDEIVVLQLPQPLFQRVFHEPVFSPEKADGFTGLVFDACLHVLRFGTEQLVGSFGSLSVFGDFQFRFSHFDRRDSVEISLSAGC